MFQFSSNYIYQISLFLSSINLYIYDIISYLNPNKWQTMTKMCTQCYFNSYSLTRFPRKSLNPVPSHVPIKSINLTEQ